ncbi:MAG TPA: glycosyltransferase family 2 protein, partial [Acidimicrobiales bacterium]
WDEPLRLLGVGASADKAGVVRPYGRHELDQEQHDAVRDVFVAPGGCTLVRADLFATIGGFDPVMRLYGEDLDLSWRAQIAGARVVVAPGARVRHLEAMSSGRRGVPEGERIPLDELRTEVRPLQLRHRLRAVLKNYSRFHLVRVFPQVLLLAVVEFFYGLLTGRRGTSRDIVGAWRWNLSKSARRELRQARKAVKALRVLPDSEVRPLQARGSARMTAFIRGQLAADGRLRRAPVLANAPRMATDESLRLPLVVVGALGLVLAFGSRSLIAGRLTAVGELTPFPESPWPLVQSFFSGWRPVGLGSAAPAPPAFAFLGLAGTVLLGGMGLLQKLLVVGMLPLGLAGMFRLAKPVGSRRARLVAVLVYAAMPLFYNDIARGHWSGLLLFGTFPWMALRLLRATGIEPFGAGVDRRAALRREVLPLGVGLALLTAFVPSAPLVLLLVAVALVAGGLLAGEARAGFTAVGVVLGATAVTAVLLFPWSLDFVLPGSEWSAVTGVDPPVARALGFGTLLRFETGPMGAAPGGWAFMLAAALPLLIGRGWRLQWAARCWAVALVCWFVALAGGHDWLPIPLPATELLLAPAAVALALSTALGMAAFEVDLPRYRFGWRQAASLAAAAAVVVGALPVLVATVGGRWNQPKQDFAHLLSWMAEHQAEGDFRVLWLGDPEALPLAGWRLRDGLAYATSQNGPPVLGDRWPTASPGAAGLVADAVDLAVGGETTRMGKLLAPTAVRYVVVPAKASPSREHTRSLPPDPQVVAALDAQVDLKQLEGDESLRLYENAAWLPARAALGEGAAVAGRGRGSDELLAADLAGSTPVLPRRRSDTRYQGPVDGGREVYLSAASSPQWELRVDGDAAPRRTAFGWANAFTVDTGGPATLRYRTSPLRWAAIAIEVGVWVVAVRALVRRRREARAEAGVAP